MEVEEIPNGKFGEWCDAERARRPIRNGKPMLRLPPGGVNAADQT
jgi:hypothetical protein